MVFLDSFAQAGPIQYVPFDVVAKPLAVALGLSLVVERGVELLKNVLDLFPATAAGRAVRRMDDVEAGIEELARFHGDAAAGEADEEGWAKLAELKARIADAPKEEQPSLEKQIAEARSQLGASTELDERFRRETLLVQPASDPNDGTTLRAFMLQATALAAGIIAARVAGVELFGPLVARLHPGMVLWGGTATDYLLTGLLIGGGSGPAHMLIRFIGERRITLPEPIVEETVVARQAATAPPADAQVIVSGDVVAGPTAPAGITVPGAASGWLDIPYAGGVDREKLEAVHRRPADPQLIVYHHTAMPLASTFDDVVRVIRERKDAKGRPWITGYNCVVTHDGGIHAFCRWDRYGNHAAGYNACSLGIALNGNFETDPSVPFSNPDGRYGAPAPTPAQLESAARVVALWTYLYDIPATFHDALPAERPPRGIIPHKALSPKTCPGTNFPYAEFRKLVAFHRDAWSGAPGQERIHAFSRKPFLFV